MKKAYHTNHIPYKYLRWISVAASLFLFSITMAQDKTTAGSPDYLLNGIVRDAHKQEPVPAAQIMNLNNGLTALTDEKGSFRIRISSTSDLLLVSAFDYNRREIPVRGRRDSLVVELYPDFFTGRYDEISVPTGPVRSSFHTGSASVLSRIERPLNTTVDADIQSGLGGAVRAISHSALNGVGSSLFIRGYHSIYRNAQPLFVVDGVIWDSNYDRYTTHDGYFPNALADIDLNDIENVTILKDATSLYGSKGSNGIIVINTRRASDFATRIVVNALGGVTERPASLPMMDGDQFRIYTTELLGSSDYTTQQINALPFLQDNPALTGYESYHNATDWDNEVYRTGYSQSYNIGVTGGDDKALYSFSLGYFGNKGVVKNTDLQRLNMRFNGDFRMADFLLMGINLGFANIDRVLLDDGANFYTSPTYLAAIKAPFLSPYSYTPSGTLTTDFEDSDIFGVGNPTAIIENSLNTNKHYRLNLGAKPVFVITPSLSVSSQFDYSLDKMKETYFNPMVGVADRFLPGLGVSENVFRSLQMRSISIFDDTRLHYTKNLTGFHRINVIAGWRYLSCYSEGDYAEGHNSGTDQKRNLLNELEFKKTEGFNNATKSISNYAQIDYAFNNRYFATATISMDGSSRFGRETQGGIQLFNRSWGIFPSIGLGWLASSEQFFQSAAFVNHLKVRTSFGLSGNDDIDPYAWSYYFTSIQYMDRANGIILGNIGNSGIQWEKTARFNLGLDASLLNDYLSVSADFFIDRTTDLLYLEELPVLTGSGYFWKNGGALSNTGFEASASAKIVNYSNLQWEVGVIAGHYKNRILTAPATDRILQIYDAEILTAEGYPAGVFWGFKTRGILADEAQAEAADLIMVDAEGNPLSFGPGDLFFDDLTEDGIIDERDKQIIGDPNPDLYGSFMSRTRYRNFLLEARFTYSYGNDVYNYHRRTLESGKDFTNQTIAVLSRWRTEGQLTDQPEAVYGDPMGNARFSDRWIEDGSYLRFKSLSLSYTIPYTGEIIEGLTIWIAANNLWTWTNYLGRDPEVSINNSVLYQGIDAGLLPLSRSYFFGIRMNL
ncbi:MAG: SusC/RagA family TonB-linked outer membrane protein [Bacteroidales bacterium]|nr:SusC/RagA family TonB-linked outer membrane protein [Bacteroidales bacterium]MBN2699627.1 SusC/RagA family TonB-linked outer membrane protein [Bacteroidales bacterium]